MFITSSAALTPDTVMYDSVFPTVEIDLMEGMDNMAVELGLTPAQAELMSSSSPESMLALVPHTGTQDRRTQLLLMGWPLHLPEPEVARHLYVYVFSSLFLVLYTSF